MSIELLKVSGKDALSSWEALAKEAAKSGKYPVILGEYQFALSHSEFLSTPEAGNPSAILQAASRIDAAKWIAEARVETLAGFSDFGDGPTRLEKSLLGHWPKSDVEAPAITASMDLTSREFHDQVGIALIPTANSWEAPAHLGWGGWNECPSPEVHVALHRFWAEKYNSRIISMSSDIIECQVLNPPTKQEEALELAWQQYWYCSDIVDQGCDTIAQLAASLCNGEIWFFWWD